MYIEPTWFDLLIRGVALDVILIIIVLFLTVIIAKTVQKIVKGHNKEEIAIITIIASVVIFSSIAIFTGDIVWNVWMEQPSIREETVTIDAIQPRPGAVHMILMVIISQIVIN